MSQESRVFRLKCEPNNYPWGKIGNESLAGVLSQEAAGPDFKIKPSEPYAELWMGTHPKSPAKVWSSSQPLFQFLAANKGLLGDAVEFPGPYPEKKEEKSGGEGHVPFLFKILTCKQALPLQIHPNKGLAEKLHKENPEQFPDTNHKPEIAVCLSDRFLGFAGFRPLSIIKSFLSSTKEISDLPQKVQSAVRDLLSAEDGEKAQESLRVCWRAFVEMKGEDVKSAIKGYTKRVGSEGVKAFDGIDIEAAEKGNLMDALKVLDEYNGGDGSIFASLFFMNLMELKKGEGIYVGADGPHAWLSGEIVELMAASDNVLNVGFIPSSDKDSTKLVTETVTCSPQSPSELILKKQPFHKGSKGNTTVYAVPFEEFSILHIEGTESLKPLSGPGIAIVTESKGTTVGGEQAPRGSVWFVGAGEELKIGGEGEVWMAFYDGDEKSAGEVGPQ